MQCRKEAEERDWQARQAAAKQREQREQERVEREQRERQRVEREAATRLQSMETDAARKEQQLREKVHTATECLSSCRVPLECVLVVYQLSIDCVSNMH